jgi:hypothetical protein
MLSGQEGMAHPDVYSMHLCGISFPSSSATLYKFYYVAAVLEALLAIS